MSNYIAGDKGTEKARMEMLSHVTDMYVAPKTVTDMS